MSHVHLVGKAVHVSPESPSGKPWDPYSGTIAGVRENAKGLGSVEYLVTSEARPSGRWVDARLCKVEAQ